MDSTIQNKVNSVLNTGYDLNFSNIFNNAMELWKGIAVLGGVITLIYGFISYASSTLVSIVSGVSMGSLQSTGFENGNYDDLVSQLATGGYLLSNVINMIISAILYPLLCGIYKLCYNYDKTKTVDFSNAFEYYKQPYFGKLFIYSIIYSILIAIAFVLCVLPSIYLGVAWLIGVPFLVFANASPWEALENSRKVLTQQWSTVFLIVLALIGINIVGLLFCCVGLLATIPFSSCVVYILYNDIIGTGSETNEIDEIGTSSI